MANMAWVNIINRVYHIHGQNGQQTKPIQTKAPKLSSPNYILETKPTKKTNPVKPTSCCVLVQTYVKVKLGKVSFNLSSLLKAAKS